MLDSGQDFVIVHVIFRLTKQNMSDHFVVTLEGGKPWGFTLQGGADFRSPLKIGKVSL